MAAPLAKELIVVPAGGWESYFTRRLAGDRGCWAQYQYCTLGQWVGATLQNALRDDAAPVRDVDAMTWAIARLLPALLDDNEFAAVRSYLSADGGEDARRLIDLARCVAGLFDQYLVARPELINAWNSGQDWPEGAGDSPQHAGWQRRLWQAIATNMPLLPVRSLVARLGEAWHVDASMLPERVSVWLCGGVPPAHLEFLERVGKHTRVELFLVSPRFDYWGTRQQRQETAMSVRLERAFAAAVLRGTEPRPSSSSTRIAGLAFS